MQGFALDPHLGSGAPCSTTRETLGNPRGDRELDVYERPLLMPRLPHAGSLKTPTPRWP